VLLLLAASAVCVGIAPVFMPDSYDVSRHAISASGGQGVENAWIARTGFLLLGSAVLTLAVIPDRIWDLAGRWIFGAYGVSMVATAAFAHMPWEEVPYVVFEDTLHSVAAGMVGFTFTVGVVTVAIRRRQVTGRHRLFDWFAAVAAVGISVLIFNLEDVAGYVQRLMFAIAYLWFGFEAWRHRRPLID
jgi:hypothetical membrane protein